MHSQVSLLIGVGPTATRRRLADDVPCPHHRTVLHARDDLTLTSAQLAVMEIVWSLVHDMAASLLLRGLVRPDIARELIYAARKICAEEALLMVEM